MKIDILVEYESTSIFTALRKVKFIAEPNNTDERIFAKEMYNKFHELVIVINNSLIENKPNAEKLIEIYDDIYNAGKINNKPAPTADVPENLKNKNNTAGYASINDNFKDDTPF